MYQLHLKVNHQVKCIFILQILDFVKLEVAQQLKAIICHKDLAETNHMLCSTV